MQNYTAVAAAGQRGTSASPFFQFTVLRRWVYGFNFESSLVGAYKDGTSRARAIEWVSFAKFWQEKNGFLLWKNVEDMLAHSEILFSYTDEIPARNVRISQSAILRQVPVDESINKKGVIEVMAEKNGELMIEDKDVLH